MSNFVKLSNHSSSSTGLQFINLAQVTMVECSVKMAGGGLDISSVGEGKAERIEPVRPIAFILLKTASGDGLLQYDNFAEAEGWLKRMLGLEVRFSELV